MGQTLNLKAASAANQPDHSLNLHCFSVQALSGHEIDGRTISAKMDEYA